ncbi:MAG: PaaI family thioesterase [Candidatus Marinarcus sp.]|uniref:PaaI family thioesterase n=1 Tax=Candidatus Marinarcus sp. TaxID=3100987 RepID=UPI003B00C70E
MPLHNIKAFFEANDKYAKFNGMKIEEIDVGSAKTSMKIQEHHLNGAGVVHGGAVFSLADYAFAVASNSHGQLALGINASISYMKGAKEGETIFATAKEINNSNKLACYNIVICNEKEEILASFEGMVYKKNVQIV